MSIADTIHSITYSFAKISFKIILIYHGGQRFPDRSYPSLSEFCGYYQLTSSSSPILAGILTREGDSKGSGHPSLQANKGLSIPLLPSLLPLFLQVTGSNSQATSLKPPWLTSPHSGIPAPLDFTQRALSPRSYF